MRPGYAVNDIVDLLLHYSISFRNFSLRNALRGKSPNFSDFGFSNFMARMRFAGASHSCASTFFVHVCGIVFGFTQKQVIWILASAHIALMADKQAIGYRAIVNHVRNSMSKESAIGRTNGCVTSFGVDASLPQPTFIRVLWRYMFPEQFFKGFSLGAGFGRRLGIMGLHKNLQFLCQAWDAANVARHFSLGTTGVIVA